MADVSSSPPPSPPPEHDHGIDYQRQTEARVVILTLTGVAIVFVAARIYTCSMILRRSLYFEEWCILASMVIICISTVLMMLSFAWGMGLHRDILSQEQQVQAKFWYLMGTPPSLLGVSMPKISVIQLRMQCS